MSTTSTNYSAAGTAFVIPAAETERPDTTTSIFYHLQATEDHDHSATRGLGVKRLQTSASPAAAGQVQVTGHTFVYYDSTASAARTISLSGDLTTAAAVTVSGAFATTVTVTGITTVTLPTSGTLATLAGAESLTNKTIGASTLSGTVSGGGNQINNVIIGTSTPLAGSFTAIVGTSGAISGTGGDVLTVTTDTSNTGFKLINTSAAAGGPRITGFHNSATPATGDTPITLAGTGLDSGANVTIYGTLVNIIDDTTDTSEDAYWRFACMQAGAFTNVLLIGQASAAPGIAVTGASTFSSTINSQTISATAAFTGTMSLAGKVTTYNNIAAAGWGLAAVQGSGQVTAQTARSAAIASYTLGAADGTFAVSANANVSASATHSFSLDVSYTDETNTARVLILPIAQLAGAFITGGLITNVTGTGPYESAVMHIRCKASTSITIRPSNGTFTSVTYSADAAIVQTA